MINTSAIANAQPATNGIFRSMFNAIAVPMTYFEILVYFKYAIDAEEYLCDIRGNYGCFGKEV
jgi:hypothetical protein